jgi:DNA-directed RNA polymerase specialized sigma24 family protein
MNLNESYTTWVNNPTPENYEVFGHDLLSYIKGRIRKVRRLPYDLKVEMPVDVVIRVLAEIQQYDAAKSPFSVWVNYKIEHVVADLTTAYFDRREHGLFNREAPDEYKGINAKLLLNRLTKTLSVEEKSLVKYQLAGLSDTEIALEMGIPVGTVWSRWNRIKEKMRKAGE